MKTLIFVLLGLLFGAVLIASQAFHWQRIQEMFHFESFHMFGVLGSAILTAALGVWLIKRFKWRTVSGDSIAVRRKPLELRANIFGGLIFGLGWGITGACTAPLFILVGLKWQIGIVAISGAFIGTLIFGIIQQKLPK